MAYFLFSCVPPNFVPVAQRGRADALAWGRLGAPGGVPEPWPYKTWQNGPNPQHLRVRTVPGLLPMRAGCNLDGCAEPVGLVQSPVPEQVL